MSPRPSHLKNTRDPLGSSWAVGTWEGPEEPCERCGVPIQPGERCWGIGIGGGWLVLCTGCVRKRVATIEQLSR